MKLLVLSGHYFASKRQAGFHWLSKAWANLGHEVWFCTTGVSYLSAVRGKDHRLAYPLQAESRNWKSEAPLLQSTVMWTRWHPVHLRRSWLNTGVSPWFRHYGKRLPKHVAEVVAQVDAVVFESNHSLMYFQAIRKANPKAKLIYRVSDDLRLLLTPPVVLEVEAKALPLFDLVSVPSEYFLTCFKQDANIQLLNHGVEKDCFKARRPNPFPPGKHAVFVGNSHMDLDFYRLAARALPEWTFHVIGPIEGLPEAINLVRYGELPFQDTIAYLQWATVGLQTRSHEPGCESLTDSLKVIQYTLCQKAVVAPNFLASSRKNVHTYIPGQLDSIIKALHDANAHSFSESDAPPPRSWAEVADIILQQAGLSE